jgi:carnosine N-methyltransferase
LSPGSGLGRLPFEIAKLGFASQGNEFSYFMLLASNFILNRSTKVEQFTIYPYVHQTSNNISDLDPLRAIKVPDSVPQKELSSGGVDFSMCAGDFLDVYRGQKGYLVLLTG